MNTTPRRRSSTISALLLLSLAAGVAPAQPKKDVQPAPPATVYNPAPVELSLDPWKLDSVGLTMYLPVDTIAQASSLASTASVQITPKDTTWLINIQTPRTINTDTTPAEICDGVVTERFKAVGEVYIKPEDDSGRRGELVGMIGKLIEPRKTIRINGFDTERVYFSVPGNTPKAPDVVHGLTVFRTAPGQFVIFELVTTAPVFEKARSVYEATVATATFEDPTKILLTRAAGIAAGRRVLEAMTPADLRALLSGPERWERCYRPASSGADSDAKELGYRRIITRVGRPGELGMGNGPEGYIVQMDARMLENGLTVDSSAAYFVSMDFETEFWTIRNAIRRERKVETLTERGARMGMSMVVQLEGSGLPKQEVRPVFQSDGYISRAMATILPQILVKSKVAADFGFYGYQSDEMTVCYRRESLEQPVDRPGLWKLTTRLSEKKPPMVSYFNGKGELMRTEMPDGSVWEPITKDKLVQLWKSKGLPMEKSEKSKR
jgi:hypothetical protein